jgi:Fur family ferric uptake transcriptional regulator
MKNCCDHKLDQTQAGEVLANFGLNRTKTKISILVVLSHSKAPLSVVEIHKSLKNKCDISTIFRNMAQFKEKNMIHEVNLGEDFSRFELALNDRKNEAHHHHVRCRECSTISLIEKCDLDLFEKMISKLGFKEMEHSLEFTGICSKCS